MASKSEIAIRVEAIESLGSHLHNEVLFARKFVAESERPAIEKEWMTCVDNACNYSAFLLKSFLDSIDKYSGLPIEQFFFYVGKLAIQHLLEVINVFEQILNKFIVQNSRIRTLIERRIDRKVEVIERCWASDCTGNDKKQKKAIVGMYKSKVREMAFIRQSLSGAGVIDKTDRDIWSFAWDIRNSMHMNFTATKAIDFQYPDIRTGKIYQFKFAKGEELYHPQDLLDFYIITEQLIFILLKILSHFDKNEEPA